MRTSVALCTYNGEAFLREQLFSIIHQTLPPDELIICDDHSTDGTVAIIKAVMQSSSIPVEVHLNPVNLGSTKNFEKAVQLCHGDIIIFADQDDIWKPRKLEIISGVFSSDPGIGLVFSNAELIDAGGMPLGRDLWTSVGFTAKEYKKFNKGKQFEVLLKRNFISGTTMAFRSTLNELILPFSEKWIHDEWIATVALTMGITAVPIPELLVSYRQHSDQRLGGYKSVWEIIDTSLHIGAEDFENLVLAWQEIRERIIARRGTLDQVQSARLELLEKKASHFHQRIFIRSSSGLPKLRAIIHEAKLKNYKYFSCGWLSILRDIVLK